MSSEAGDPVSKLGISAGESDKSGISQAPSHRVRRLGVRVGGDDSRDLSGEKKARIDDLFAEEGSDPR